MAGYAMSYDRLGLWIGERAKSATLRHPQATSLSMLDGAAADVVAGPVSMMPEEWVCPLLGVDPDDFNHERRHSPRSPPRSRGTTRSSTRCARNRKALNPYSWARQTARSTHGPGAWASTRSVARVVPIDEPERYRARTAAADIVPLRRPFRSPGSRPPPAPSGCSFRRSRAVTRHSDGRLSHAPHLDAEPVRPGYIAAGAARAGTCMLTPLTPRSENWREGRRGNYQ